MSKVVYSYFFTFASLQYLFFFLPTVVGDNGFKPPNINHSLVKPSNDL